MEPNICKYLRKGLQTTILLSQMGGRFHCPSVHSEVLRETLLLNKRNIGSQVYTAFRSPDSFLIVKFELSGFSGSPQRFFASVSKHKEKKDIFFFLLKMLLNYNTLHFMDANFA